MILWWGRKKRQDAAAADETSGAGAPDPAAEPARPGAPARPQAPDGEAPAAAAAADAPRPGFFARLAEGLRKSSTRLAEGVGAVFTRRRLDQDTLDELEELLIRSDMGAPAARRITRAIARDRFERDVSEEEVRLALAEEISAILKPREEIVDFAEGPRPRVVLFVGVNGSGKTTTVGKIAAKLSGEGAGVLVAAGDTFRAAAVEQLRVWADRAGAAFVSRPQGADAAALAFEAVELARATGRDVVLIDTAGRLQNKAQLMDELAKTVRAIRKVDPGAPHEVLLVLDATVGQNALSQVEAFRHTAGVTGLVMTKLDGTAKGGVLVAIAEAHALPIHFVGVGEAAEDLHPFSAEAFSRALVGVGTARRGP